MGHDQVVFQAVAAGNLELSQFLPVVADSLLTSLDLLTHACDLFARLCVQGLTANDDQCRRQVETSTATLTALVEMVGYHEASRLAVLSRKTCKSIRELVLEQGLLTPQQFDGRIGPDQVLRLGSASPASAAVLRSAGEGDVDDNAPSPPAPLPQAGEGSHDGRPS